MSMITSTSAICKSQLCVFSIANKCRLVVIIYFWTFFASWVGEEKSDTRFFAQAVECHEFVDIITIPSRISPICCGRRRKKGWCSFTNFDAVAKPKKNVSSLIFYRLVISPLDFKPVTCNCCLKIRKYLTVWLVQFSILRNLHSRHLKSKCI